MNQAPEPGTALPPGIHTVTMSAQDSSGKVGTCDITLTVIDPSPVVLNCPSNIVVDCTSSNGAVVTFVATARSACTTNVAMMCNPAPGTVFPVGTT